MGFLTELCLRDHMDWVVTLGDLVDSMSSYLDSSQYQSQDCLFKTNINMPPLYSSNIAKFGIKSNDVPWTVVSYASCVR